MSGDLGIRVLAPRRHHRANPLDEAGAGWHAPAQIRQLEMRVGVDQPWHHHDVAQIDVARVIGRRTTTHRPVRGDATAIDRRPTRP